ncbi:MAG: SHOCT domain-containing protein [Candidatus Bathyarchaeota archaeon]|jgi:putative membrane protein
MWFGWGFMWGPIFLILCAVGIYYLIKSQTHDTCSAHAPTQQIRITSSKALELLKERYAKGEITKEQFQEIKQDLQQ